MSDFNSLVQYTVENISRPIKYIIYKLTEFIRVVDKFVFRQIPTGVASGYATIEKIEGNTVAWNQLLKQGKLVDMGLPSGLLWATCNIDITQDDGFAASPFQYGCTMFSWGNIEGHNTPASDTTFDYNWGSVNAQEPWYEGQPYGSTPGSTLTADIVAGDTYDSARYNLGSLFKMPTSAQFQELFSNCDFVQADGTTVITSTDKRVTVNGILGIYLKSRVNGNLIFFSASGYGSGTSWFARGSNGFYWSSSFNSARYARNLYFRSGGVIPYNVDYRYYGFAVRAVVNPNTIDTGHNNHKYYVTKDINHDLTAILGSGNEPTTVAEFEEWREQNGLPSVAAYNTGELLSVKMSGMQTEDSSQQTLDTIALDVTTITGINSITNVREVIFPDGMKSAKNIADVLDLVSDIAIKKLYKINLGDYNYSYNSSYAYFVAPASIIIGQENSWVSNFIIDAPYYNAGGNNNNSDMASAPNFACYKRMQSARLYIKNTNFSGSSLLKQSLNGVYLIAERQNYITYTDLQDGNGNPLNPRYKVEQGGTEQVLPVNTSTPTTVAPTLTTVYTKDVH